MGPHFLERLFAPKSVAVFGASEREDSVGGRVFDNLLAGGFEGEIYPINPKYETLRGRRCYPDLGRVGAPVDVAIIATPAATVPGIMQQCGEHRVRAAVIHSAGFAEAGTHGRELEREVLALAQRFRIRVLGPNCLGLMRPSARFNATFSKSAARPGPLALISQSGALCTAILDWAETRSVGFSAVVSLGEGADIDFGDLLDYFALDEQTRSILLYIEGVRDARAFMSGLRIAARFKPVVVIKAGRHAEGSRVALSHTGALVGSDDVFDAALARAGAVRATSVDQLFAAAQLLAAEHRVRGNRLAMVTNAGGPAVLATDRAADLGVALPALAPATMAALDAALPAHWSHGNPVDVLGDAGAERYTRALDACLKDPNIDGVLVMLTPQAMTDPMAVAEAVIRQPKPAGKLVLTSWMGGSRVLAARDRFAAAGIPSFPSPERAVEAFAYLANYQRNQELLRQVPGPLDPRREADVEGARLIVETALAEGRRVLTGIEAYALLSAFRIPHVSVVPARSASEALVAAQTLGFPVALKILSPDVVHKSDVNGVRLNVGSAQAVRSVYNELIESVKRQRPEARIEGVTVERMYRRRDGRELHVGVARDQVFGPAVSFGLGGTAIEVLRDRAIALPPLNTLIAQNLIKRTRAGRLLGAFRHLPPARVSAVEQVLLAVSEMVCELPEIISLDINPLMADADGVTALDARFEIGEPGPGAKRYAHMAIHPYPSHLVSHLQLADGTDILLRPIRPEDADLEAAFVHNLSPQSKYMRFMQTLQELTPEMLVRFTQIDYDRELALVAITEQEGREVEVAVTRYSMNPDGESCEFALVVADAWQRKGIGSRLLSVLMDAARARGIRVMEGQVLADNTAMLSLVRRFGFRVRRSPGNPGVYDVSREL
ncbi:MAG TPA: bifunctional acetate--CoA ligase family protein/GNAT family N-acetyltransferase [Burkholderiales bacterium]